MDLSMPSGPGSAGGGGPEATAAGMQPVFQVPVGVGFMDPTQHDGRISYDDADMQAMYGHQFNQHSMPSALLGRKHAPDRRPLRFWQPFNDWWRSELTRLGRRPTSEEIGEWYMEAADRTWGEIKPTLQETRVHAKCLRSLPLVRDYFRNYRAKKKAKGSDGSGYDEDTGDGEDTGEGTDNGGSSRRQRPPAPKRARLGVTPSNSNPELAAGPSHSHAKAGGNNSDPGAAAAAGGSYGGGMDMLQAYQAQYWDPAQNEEYARQAMLMQQMAIYQQLAAQQLTGDVQYALLAQQQRQALEAAADPTKFDEATSAAAAALAKAAPESHCEPGSGAVGDDEHEHGDHEPLSASGATQPRPRQPAQADTATSNATSHPAAAAADAAAALQAAEEAVSQHMSGSVSRDKTPQQEAAGAAGQQRKQQSGTSQQGVSGSPQQQERGGEEQGDAQPMDAEGPGADAGDGKAQAGSGGSPAAPAAADSAPVKAEEQQQQSADADKSRQQPQLDLGDSTAKAHAAAEAKAHQQQQQQQTSQVADAKGKAPTAADVQAALSSAAALASAAVAPGNAGPAPAARAAAAAGSTAVSPYIQGISAAAAAAITGGLNLADSPHLRGAVSQEEPHPGAQLPEAAAAALAAAPPAAPGHQPNSVEHRAHTPGVEAAGGVGAAALSIDIEEAELLNDVEMGGMSHGELVAHIRRVQQELLSKRELLARSFDQLRRTQDRLARRERKLAKEQQKCKQYQSAVATWQAAWQAAALPSLDPAGQEAPQGEGAPAAEAAQAEPAAEPTAEAKPVADAAEAVQQQ